MLEVVDSGVDGGLFHFANFLCILDKFLELLSKLLVALLDSGFVVSFKLLDFLVNFLEVVNISINSSLKFFLS